MTLARASVALFAAFLLAGCTIGTVSTPAHFGTAGDFDFLDAGLRPVPQTNEFVATPIPD